MRRYRKLRVSWVDTVSHVCLGRNYRRLIGGRSDSLRAVKPVESPNSPLCIVPWPCGDFLANLPATSPRCVMPSKGEQGALSALSPAPIVQREILRGYVGTWMTGRGAINWRNVRRQKNSRIQLVSVFLCRGTDAVSSVPTAAFGAHYSVTRSRLTVCGAALRGPRQKLLRVLPCSSFLLPFPSLDFASSCVSLEFQLDDIRKISCHCSKFFSTDNRDSIQIL